ncbi:MAG: hypothetical protein ACRCTA_00695, partial [Bacilli bacterium]
GYYLSYQEATFKEYQSFALNEYKTLIEVIAFYDELQEIAFLKQLIKLLEPLHPMRIILENKYFNQSLDITKSKIKYVFPNRLYEMKLLEESLIQPNYISYYLLGLLYYDKLRYHEAHEMFIQAYALNPHYSKLSRVLAISYYNQKHDLNKALELYHEAFNDDKEDAKILYEYDQLKKINNESSPLRKSYLDQYPNLVQARDDLYLEYITLHNELQEYEIALSLLKDRIFHPFEGGEGKIILQYQKALIGIGKAYLIKQEAHKALACFKDCLNNPANFNEALIHNTQIAHINYYIACAYEAIDLNKATLYYQKAFDEKVETSSKLSYKPTKMDLKYYQVLAAVKLNLPYQAFLDEIKQYALTNLNSEVEIDYFAISLPELLIFNVDLNTINKAHAHYLLGLAYYFEDKEKALSNFKKCLEYDINYQDATIFINEHY